MSFIGIVKEELAIVDADAVAAAKVTLNYIDGVITQDLLPILEKSLLAAIEKLGQEAIAALLGTAVTSTLPPAA